MYYQQFEDDVNVTSSVETTLKKGILTTRTQKGDWRARNFYLSDKTLQIVEKKPRQDLIENLLQLGEIESILYPVSLLPGEPSFDLPNKSNYPATFGIQYTEISGYKSKKVIAYAGSVDECRKWVSVLRNVIGKYKDGSLPTFVSHLNEDDSSSLEDSSEMKEEHKMIGGRVYNLKRKVWEDRNIKMDNGVLVSRDLKGKLREEFHLVNLIEFGYPGQVNGSHTPPSYIPNMKCIAMRFQTSLLQTSNLTMYIHHADEAKNWRDTIRSHWEGTRE